LKLSTETENNFTKLTFHTKFLDEEEKEDEKQRDSFLFLANTFKFQ
jgi:hypothetical protein